MLQKNQPKVEKKSDYSSAACTHRFPITTFFVVQVNVCLDYLRNLVSLSNLVTKVDLNTLINLTVQAKM